MKLAGWMLLALLLAVVVSCGPTIREGQMFDATKINQLIKGGVTEAQVVQLLGKPGKVEKSHSGGNSYIYQYYVEQYVHWYAPSSYERHKLVVDLKNGVVEDYHYTKEFRGKITEADKK